MTMLRSAEMPAYPAACGGVVDSGLYHRQGKAVTNFDKQLPSPQSELAQQALKDPYMFDFFSVGKEAHERDIENALVEHISRFLLELGAGFAYVGRQVPLEVGGEDFSTSSFITSSSAARLSSN